MDARGADERRDRTRFLRRDLVHDGLERQGLRAESERASRDRWDQRNFVPISELVVAGRVFLVHGVEEAARLLAEPERIPDVADPCNAVHLALGPARAL